MAYNRHPLESDDRAAMRQAATRLHLLRHFVARDLKQRYLGSLWGGLWAITHPLLLLAIYSVVFVEILRVRLPESVGADFVPFLVAGLWPWTLFAESLNRGATAITEASGLLAKVALPREVIALAPVGASFVLHGTGFLVAIAVLFALGKDVAPGGVPLAIAILLLELVFTAGLALVFAALNVFVRDFAQLLAQALTLLFFLTPVFFARSMVPPKFGAVLDLNPMTSFVELIRSALAGAPLDGGQLAYAVGSALVALALGAFVFGRLAKHFEDFL